MSLYLDTNTLTLSDSAQDGFLPFSTRSLNTLSDSLSINSAVLSKAPETAEMISNFVINQLKTNTNRKEVKDLFDAYENFCKKSVELLSKKDETTAPELTSVHKVRACFKNAALLFNREKVAYDKAIQTMDAEQFASWGEHRNRLKQMLDFCSENPNSVMKDVLTGPHFSTVSILNEKEASTICDIFSIETQNIEKSDRNRILLNTFVDYCSKNPSSFLNRTCMPLFKIFLGKATINGTKNVESQVNILQKTISNYFNAETFSKFLDGETSFQTISLDKMHSLFHSLETAYQEKERQSLLNYLNRLRERGQLIES